MTCQCKEIRHNRRAAFLSLLPFAPSAQAYNYRKSSAVIQYVTLARTEGGMLPGYRASEGYLFLSGPSPRNMEAYGNLMF